MNDKSLSLSILPPPPAAPTQDVAEILQRWRQALTLRVESGELAAITELTYRRGLEKFLRWCQTSAVTQVEADTIRAWKAAELAAGRKPATINARLSGVKSLFAWAEGHHYLTYNPAKDVPGVPQHGTTFRHAREALTDLEFLRVLAQPDRSTPWGLRDLAILSLMVYTGVRTVEVRRANLADLRTESGQLVLYFISKGNHEPDELVVIANLNAQNALYDWLAKRGEKPGPLFFSLSNRSLGQRFSLRGLRGLMKSYFRSAGVRGNKSAHSLRHTAIIKVIVKSDSIHKAQSVARHKTIDATMIYFHEIDRLENPGEGFIDYGQ